MDIKSSKLWKEEGNVVASEGGAVDINFGGGGRPGGLYIFPGNSSGQDIRNYMAEDPSHEK